MKYNPNTHHRRSIRLQAHDYAQAGAYFVTICTHQRQCLFGTIQNASPALSKYGRVVKSGWHTLPHSFPNVKLDVFVIMPNHLHGIVIINDEPPSQSQRRGEAFDALNPGITFNPRSNASPLPQPAIPPRPNGTQPGSLSAIIQNFKAISTRKINQIRNTPGTPVWQRNYYEHVIRNEDDLNTIRQYIQNNPAKWPDDRYNPANPG